MNAQVTGVEEKHGGDGAGWRMMDDGRTDGVEARSACSGNEQAAEERDIS